MSKKVIGQRGHARILVGVRLSRAGTVTAQIESFKDGVLRRTVTQEKRHPKGRAFMRMDATGDDGFQLSQGVYRITVSATDPKGRLSNKLARNFRLTLTPPRGRFDAYTVPLLPAFRRKNPVGQLIAAVAPGGAAADAGIRRGDVVTRIGGRWITTPGSLANAKRALLANRAIKVRIVRDGTLFVVKMTPKPDWTARPEYDRTLRVASTRAKNDFAIHYARVAQLIDIGKLRGAKRVKGAWRRSWRNSAPSQYLDGRIKLAEGRDKPALGAYIRAAKKDPKFTEAIFGQGSALSSLEKRKRAVAAFDKAAELDPKSASARAFAAYVLIGQDDFESALERANQAVQIDRLYPDAQIPRGIALLGRGEKATGLQALRRGLMDLDSTSRAERIIDENLEPSDP
jgi:Flp pilus assembly protein TadD